MSDIEDDAGEWTDLEDGDEDEPYRLDFGPPFFENEQYKSIPQVISLKDNCLDCITKNFDRFNNAFLSSEDTVLRRQLEFLQRVYSSHVIHSLSGKELLRDKHLDFLINEYLNELDLRVFVKSGCSLKAIEKRIVLVGNGFTNVSFDFPYCCVLEDSISEFLSATICHLSNVEVLHILQKCSDATLENISSFCTKLSELNIDGSSNVTIKGLKMLCNKQRDEQPECLIKVLSIRDIKGVDSVITFLLNNMPHLEVLNYNNLPSILHSMHKEDLKNNTLNSVKKYNLTKLDFLYSGHILPFDDRVDDSKAEVLHVWAEVCPNIKTVCINFSTQDCLDLISRFENLENLTVGNVFDTTIGNRMDFNSFFKSNGRKLRKLQIDGFALSVPILIESCPKLQDLVLTDVQFQPLKKNSSKGQASSQKSLHSLGELCLVDITFSDQYAEDSITSILLSSPNIKKLSFELCKFDNSEMSTKLAKFCEDSTLQHLRFYNCNIDIALLESIILTCSSLLSLTIDSCENIRSDEAFSLHQLKDTARSFVKIVYTNYASDEENSFYQSHDDEFYDDIYSDYEHDEGSDDYDVDDDYLWYANDM